MLTISYIVIIYKFILILKISINISNHGTINYININNLSMFHSVPRACAGGNLLFQLARY